MAQLARPHYRTLVNLALIATTVLLSVNARAEKALIAVASNFSAPMQRIVTEFEKQTPHRIHSTFGSSGKMYAQIMHGAPFDAFFSADQVRPQLLETNNKTLPASRITYAIGRIALWSRQPVKGLENAEIVKLGRYNKLALANPTLAPYGLAAKQTLEYIQLEKLSQPKWVRGENIGQTYQFVHTGNADIGFVALSQIIGEGGESHIKSGSAWVVPAHYHQPILQDAVLLSHGEKNSAAIEFMAFMQSETAYAILNEFGYGAFNTAQPPQKHIDPIRTSAEPTAHSAN